jgi:hypothetical protein
MKNEETNRAGADDLERRLSDQPLKRIPPAWRNEILAAAQEASAPRTALHASRFTFHALWQRLVWPHPKAWAALATVWAVIFLLNYSSHEATPLAKSQPQAPPTLEARALLAQQRLLLAELTEQPAREAERPKTPRARPHSQRHQEFSIV